MGEHLRETNEDGRLAAVLIGLVFDRTLKERVLESRRTAVLIQAPLINQSDLCWNSWLPLKSSCRFLLSPSIWKSSWPTCCWVTRLFSRWTLFSPTLSVRRTSPSFHRRCRIRIIGNRSLFATRRPQRSTTKTSIRLAGACPRNMQAVHQAALSAPVADPAYARMIKTQELEGGPAILNRLQRSHNIEEQTQASPRADYSSTKLSIPQIFTINFDPPVQNLTARKMHAPTRGVKPA